MPTILSTAFHLMNILGIEECWLNYDVMHGLGKMKATPTIYAHEKVYKYGINFWVNWNSWYYYYVANRSALLGIKIDQHPTFLSSMLTVYVNINVTKEIIICIELDVYLIFKEMEIIYHTFNLAYFNYCPMVWYVWAKVSIMKIKLIQDWVLRFILNNQKSTYHEL